MSSNAKGKNRDSRRSRNSKSVGDRLTLPPWQSVVSCSERWPAHALRWVHPSGSNDWVATAATKPCPAFRFSGSPLGLSQREQRLGSYGGTPPARSLGNFARSPPVAAPTGASAVESRSGTLGGACSRSVVAPTGTGPAESGSSLLGSGLEALGPEAGGPRSEAWILKPQDSSLEPAYRLKSQASPLTPRTSTTKTWSAN